MTRDIDQSFIYAEETSESVQIAGITDLSQGGSTELQVQSQEDLFLSLANTENRLCAADVVGRPHNIDGVQLGQRSASGMYASQVQSINSSECCNGQGPFSERPVTSEISRSTSGTNCYDDKWSASGRSIGQVKGHWVSDTEQVNSKDEQSADCGITKCYTGTFRCEPVIASTCPMSIRSKPRHHIGGIPSQMNVNAWDYYLSYEVDPVYRKYLEDGILHGFAIVDDETIDTYYCENYLSVLKDEAFDFVDALLMSEIRDGKYVKATSIPHCVHSLGAIPKADGSYRPITDCRRPEGVSINNHMETTFQPFNYMTIDEVASHVSQGCYMATVDIASAYRSIHIREDQWTYQGIMWPVGGDLVPLWDARLAFGLRCAPFIFSEISDFVATTMGRLGFRCVANYLDDFLVFGESFQECQLAQSTLITLLGDLGFCVSWKKCASPSTCVRYLGILIDSVTMSLSLPDDKLLKLKGELEFFKGRSRATKRQIQRLCGVIAHCAKVVRGGRTFSRRIIDMLSGLGDNNPRIRLSEDFKLDLDWWLSFAKDFNGKENIIFPNNGDGHLFSTDSCLKGYGILSDFDWQAGYFNSDELPKLESNCDQSHGHWLNVKVGDATNINFLELVPVWLALVRYSESWKDSHVLCLTDNTQVVAMLRKGHSVNKLCMTLLRRIFWICAKNNIYLTPKHIAGHLNVIPDLLSRICISNDMYDISQYYVCCSERIGLGHGCVNSRGGSLVLKYPIYS